MKNRTILVFSAVAGIGSFLLACSRPVDTPLTEKVNNRVEIERIALFHDDSAYGNERGVYIIRDTKTGKEFLGVSGVGISEVETTGGKNAHQVER